MEDPIEGSAASCGSSFHPEPLKPQIKGLIRVLVLRPSKPIPGVGLGVELTPRASKLFLEGAGGGGSSGFRVA